MNKLEFAIAMENEGEKYYTEQAGKNKGSSLHSLFLKLAKDERSHAEILSNKFAELSYELTESELLFDSQNVFKGVGDFKSEIRKIPSQVELYREVLDREAKSVELYKQMLAMAIDEKDKDLFEFLVLQETKHFNIFDEMVSLVERPEEWVEDAEFGTRKDY